MIPRDAHNGSNPWHGPVLLYDGECGLCNACVHGLLRLDRRARLRFSALQGEPAQRYLRARGLPADDFDSMVFVPRWNLASPPLFRTDAALAALREVGGVWRAFAWLRVIPAACRDPLYRLVARLRYRIWGVSTPTRPPRPEWAGRFIV